MEINYIKRQDLDVEKYDSCIENAIQSRIYAFSWYLDIVADNWDVLVLDDYEAVMPVPWKRKYGVKYVTQPYFCQQLGVFSFKDNKELQNLFFSNIPIIFLKISLNLHSGHKIFLKEDTFENYVLKIYDNYDDNYKKLNKNRKRVLKKSQKNNLQCKKIELSFLLKIAGSSYNNLPYKLKDYEKLNKLSLKAIEKEMGFVYGVYANGDFLGGIFFLKDKKRITYLFSVVNEEGKKKNAITYLIIEVLKKNLKKNLILDFEGSKDKGISRFYRSFGASKEYYFQYKINAIKRVFF